uniref:Transcription repressor n=1 Tax=Kalanchoe fedtschenkoi TaxID=63787 RepID=A0A7N0TLV9_KALFE
MHPRRLLQLCFSFVRRQRQHPRQPHHLLVAYAAPFTKYTSRCIPLPTISECDEGEDEDGDEDESRVPDLAMLYSSSRFFFSAPGTSSSIITDPSSSVPYLLGPVKVARNSVAVHTLSANPHLDFKRSMQEMVEASRLVKKETAASWSFLHDMLLCYLALNHKTTHKYIIRAFADLLVNLVVAADTTSSSNHILDYEP